VYFGFAIYFLLIFAVFVGLVQPWIHGDISTRIGADSDRYWDAARTLFDPEHDYVTGLVTFQGNYLGPVIVAAVLKRQILVVAFNLVLFLLSVKLASTIRGVTAYVFLALLMMNAESAVALITLNKEIFCIVSAVLIAKYLLSDEHPPVYLGLALILSLATRWEQSFLVLLVAGFTRKNSFFSRRHKLAVFSVIAAITVSYPLAVRFMEEYFSSFIGHAQGANTIMKLDHVQESFGFPLVVIPKTILNVMGQLTKPTYYLSEFWENGFVDVHSQIILPFFSIALFVLLLVARRRGKLAVDRPVALLIFVYFIGTSVTPFVQPRYEYFVYVLLCVELSRNEASTELVQHVHA
jgi:hypothetical protein